MVITLWLLILVLEIVLLKIVDSSVACFVRFCVNKLAAETYSIVFLFFLGWAIGLERPTVNSLHTTTRYVLTRTHHFIFSNARTCLKCPSLAIVTF